ncbi:MAG: DUF6134 family protein [Burkholderiaceae bacterium]
MAAQPITKSSPRARAILLVAMTIAGNVLGGTRSEAGDLTAGPASMRTQWDFTVLLDDKVVGTHGFSRTRAADGDGGNLNISSRADFAVRFLGLTVYRYRHEATERWRDGCLESIEAHTNDDGRLNEVSGRRLAAGFTIETRDPSASTPPGRDSAPGCTSSFAYWDPRLDRHRLLLDPGTGQMTAVSFEDLPPREIEVAGRPIAVRGMRILGAAQPIDVWYDARGWAGLDTTVAGDRRLSYRLR